MTDDLLTIRRPGRLPQGRDVRSQRPDSLAVLLRSMGRGDPSANGRSPPPVAAPRAGPPPTAARVPAPPADSRALRRRTAGGRALPGNVPVRAAVSSASRGVRPRGACPSAAARLSSSDAGRNASRTRLTDQIIDDARGQRRATLRASDGRVASAADVAGDVCPTAVVHEHPPATPGTGDQPSQQGGPGPRGAPGSRTTSGCCGAARGWRGTAPT